MELDQLAVERAVAKPSVMRVPLFRTRGASRSWTHGIPPPTPLPGVSPRGETFQEGETVAGCGALAPLRELSPGDPKHVLGDALPFAVRCLAEQIEHVVARSQKGGGKRYG